MALNSIAQSAVAAGAQDAAGRSGWTSSSAGGGGFGGGATVNASNFEDFFDKYAAMVKSNVAENNAWSAQQAQINRDWQERMSNTAHQREVADLKKAGLNPVLSAMNGNGATTTSGATASTDTSANQALTSLLGSMLSSITQQENARLSAQTNLAVAEKYNAMSKYTAELQAKTQLTATNIQTAASKWMAELSAKTSLSVAQTQQATQKIVANIQAAAQRYGYELNSWTQTQVAQINGQINKELKQMGIDADFKMQDTQLAYNAGHPSNIWQAGGSLFDTAMENGILGSLQDVWNGISGNSARQNAFNEWSSSRSGSSRGSGFKK